MAEPGTDEISVLRGRRDRLRVELASLQRRAPRFRSTGLTWLLVSIALLISFSCIGLTVLAESMNIPRYENPRAYCRG